MLRYPTALGFHENIWVASRPSPRSAQLFPVDAGEAPSDSIATTAVLKTATSPGRGLGLFAVEPINAFHPILTDEALLSLSRSEDLPQLWERYLLLPPELRASFDSLSVYSDASEKEEILVRKLQQRGYSDADSLRMAAVSSRFQANAFKTEGRWAHSLFATVARINHSCTPNAHAHHRPSSGTQHVYALRDIAAGEEIEISYFDLTMPRDQRQTRSRSWGFTCCCQACNRSLGSKYEQTLASIRGSLALAPPQTKPWAKRETSETAAGQIQHDIELAKEENYPWLVTSLPCLCSILAATFEHGLLENDTARSEASSRALEEAWIWECKLTGPGSPYSASAAINHATSVSRMESSKPH